MMNKQYPELLKLKNCNCAHVNQSTRILPRKAKGPTAIQTTQTGLGGMWHGNGRGATCVYIYIYSYVYIYMCVYAHSWLLYVLLIMSTDKSISHNMSTIMLALWLLRCLTLPSPAERSARSSEHQRTTFRPKRFILDMECVKKTSRRNAKSGIRCVSPLPHCC